MNEGTTFPEVDFLHLCFLSASLVQGFEPSVGFNKLGKWSAASSRIPDIPFWENSRADVSSKSSLPFPHVRRQWEILYSEGSEAVVREAVVPHPWRRSRPGWMGPWAAWADGGQPCPWQGLGPRGLWAPSNPNHLVILWKCLWKSPLLLRWSQVPSVGRTFKFWLILCFLCALLKIPQGGGRYNHSWLSPSLEQQHLSFAKPMCEGQEDKFLLLLFGYFLSEILE